MNPIEWLAWIYGKIFLNHPFLGYASAVFFGAILFFILWSMAVDKYKEKYVPPPSSTTEVQQNLTPHETYSKAPQFKKDNSESVGIYIENSEGVKLYNNKIKGFDKGVKAENSKDIDAQGNEIDK